MTCRSTVVEQVVTGDWRHQAACLYVDPEAFFPSAENGPVKARQERMARAVCAGCPVIEQCREWALASLADGIAGGMTAEERRTERARRARAARRTRTTEQDRHLAAGEGSAVAPALPSEISRSRGQARTRVTEGHRA